MFGIKLKPVWILIRRLSPFLTLIFLFLWLRSCHGEANMVSRYGNNLQAKENVLREYRLSNGQLAHEKELLTVTNEELKEQLWIKDDSLKLLLDRLRDPVVTVKWNTRYVYDTLYLPFEIPVDHQFQRSFSKTEEWFSLSGTATQDGISIDKLSIPNTQRLVVGYKRKKPVVSVTNSNPYIVTEELEGQSISIPKRPWVFGVGGCWNLYEPPAVGFFLGYKLFEL